MLNKDSNEEKIPIPTNIFFGRDILHLIPFQIGIKGMFWGKYVGTESKNIVEGEKGFPTWDEKVERRVWSENISIDIRTERNRDSS